MSDQTPAPVTDEELKEAAENGWAPFGARLATELLAARARIAALEHLARTLWERRRQWQTNAIEVVSARARIAHLEAALNDFAEHGTRHDLNPTSLGRSPEQRRAQLERYVRTMDATVRTRARNALELREVQP